MSVGTTAGTSASESPCGPVRTGSGFRPETAASAAQAALRAALARDLRRLAGHVPAIRAIEAPEDAQELLLDIAEAIESRGDENVLLALALFAAGVSEREIARRLGRPRGTVRYWLQRGGRKRAKRSF